MKLHRSGEDYLKTILILRKQNGVVRSADVASHLKISKASVSRAMKLLREGGFLTMEEHKQLHLTPLGVTVVEEIYERHRILNELLLTIEPRQGHFDGMLAERSYQVQLLAEEMPQSVRINDLVVDSWSYDADQRMLTVTIPSTPCDELITLSVQRATTGIQNVENRKMQQEHYYDLQGRRLSSQSGLQNTVGIVRRSWADGRVTTHKIVRQ